MRLRRDVEARARNGNGIEAHFSVPLEAELIDTARDGRHSCMALGCIVDPLRAPAEELPDIASLNATDAAKLKAKTDAYQVRARVQCSGIVRNRSLTLVDKRASSEIRSVRIMAAWLLSSPASRFRSHESGGSAGLPQRCRCVHCGARASCRLPSGAPALSATSWQYPSKHYLYCLPACLPACSN